MKGFHDRGTPLEDALERELWAARPQAADDLVRAIVARVAEGRPAPDARAGRLGARRRSFSPRLVLAAAVTLSLLAAAGSLGGVGDAAAALGKAASSVANAVIPPAPRPIPPKVGSSPPTASSGPPTAGSPPTVSSTPQPKVTICHATGSSSNPFVEITVSGNAVPAHASHQNGADIIPAPPTGCPTGPPPYAATPLFDNKHHVRFRPAS